MPSSPRRKPQPTAGSPTAAQSADRRTSPNHAQLQQLPGLSTLDFARLQSYGITTTRQLQQQTQTADDRQQLARKLDLPVRHVNKWAALASLAQIPSVGCRYCGLLLHAGITSPQQLAETPLPQLQRQILRLQVAVMQRPDLCPSLPEIQTWIAQARQVDRAQG